VTNTSTLRAAIEGPLRDLAAAREYAMSTVYIPAPRPHSDMCATCGGTLPDHPAWVSLTARCASHFTY
jgi:hypothetical protein